ncbi:thioredoxin-like protein [Pholiota molesta]|nr:thioredoxin-like protein [Pholiota molesta]
MFNSFKRKLPEISIFHHPSSPPSTKALSLLKSSLSNPYPPDSDKKKPLEFNLDVVESPPTSDQLNTILSYLSPKAINPSMVFLSVRPSAPSGSEVPSTVDAIAELAQRNPNVLKWPIVVDWYDGKASVGDVEGVKGILETLRKKRDGELPEEQIDQPKGWFTY